VANFNFDDKELQIDSLFGKIFGIERMHILKKTDRLQDVIEKIAIVPEHKLVYVEDNDGCYTVQNILT
jgi:pyoverdine/dityrosine biosynthesis protein Dit1